MSDPAASGTAIELVPFEGLDSRRELWTELARKSRNIFATWEWASVWWRHLGAGAEPEFLECRRADGEPFAILPLCRVRRGPFRVHRFAGYGPADVLGPICAPEDAALAGAALRQAQARVKLTLAERLPGGPMPEAFGGRLVLREANPTLTIAVDSWQEYVAGRSRNLKEKLRRSARKLERDHQVTYRLCAGAEELSGDLDVLMRLHRDRWGEESPFAREPLLGFHRDLAAVLLEHDRLRLWTMAVDGEPVAAWYGFRFAGIESFYQSGRDRSWDKESVGFLMLAKTLEAAFDDQLDRYAFLRGNEPYKDRFADGDEGLETRALGNGPFGRSVVAVGSAALSSTPLRRLMSRTMD